MPGGLLTDLYELNMAASYLRRSMTGQATFSLFVRTLPPGRGFLVAAGLADCLRFLEDFSFTADDLSYLRETRGYPEKTLREFARLRFTGDVRAVPEGRVVFAGEPLLEVTAPVAEAQLVETVLLNHVTFQTAVATKAARCVLAARGAQLVDFSFRRTHGIDAALAVARASAIAGFAATSNVAAARRYGLAAAGTMAHSFIEAFGDEQAAFAAFAGDFPAMTTFLVDTYDTACGVRDAIEVTRRLRLPGPVGVRLDSGDLAVLARTARAILDEAGLADARIFASGSLDEYAIAALVAAGAPIDAYGVGTKMGVSADAPYLDSAYKLAAYDGRPVMKLSAGKTSPPGAKQVYRGPDGDVLTLRDEAPLPGHQPLLVPVMYRGRPVSAPEPLAAAQQRCRADLAGLPPAARALRDPVPVPVRISDQLKILQDRVTRDLRRRTGAQRAGLSLTPALTAAGPCRPGLLGSGPSPGRGPAPAAPARSPRPARPAPTPRRARPSNGPPAPPPHGAPAQPRPAGPRCPGTPALAGRPCMPAGYCAQPLMTPSGTSRATLRHSPAPSAASTTSVTSL